MDTLLVRPLVIVEQFGQLGVMVFFLISGFIITHVARSESPGRFCIRRVFRIYPAYWLVIACIVGFGLFDSPFDYSVLHDWTVILRIATITNYLHDPQHVVLGVGWTLQIEVMFYAVVALATPLIRRAPLLAICVELAFVALVIVNAHSGSASWFLFAANVAYLPYLLIGQLIYFYWAEGMRGGHALLAGWLCYFVIVFGMYQIHTNFLEPEHSRMLCLAFALGIFVWALNFGNEIGTTRVPRFFSDISYSLYLVQGPLLLLLAKLKPMIGFGNVAALATLAAIGLAFFIHRFVERPFIAWGRWLSNRFTRNSPAEVVHV